MIFPSSLGDTAPLQYIIACAMYCSAQVMSRFGYKFHHDICRKRVLADLSELLLEGHEGCLGLVVQSKSYAIRGRSLFWLALDQNLGKVK